MKQVEYLNNLELRKYADSYNVHISSNNILSQFFEQLDIPESVYEKTWTGLKNAIEGQWWISSKSIAVIHSDISCVTEQEMVDYLWIIRNFHVFKYDFTFVFKENDRSRIEQLYSLVETGMSLIDLIAIKDEIWKTVCGGDEIVFGETDYLAEKYRFVAQIQKVTNKAELFDELAKKLHFPSYFGRNWNALDELYRDFHWINEKEIVIVHENVSSLPTDDLKLYINIILDSLDSWKQDTNHILKYVFKEKDKAIIQSATNTGKK